MWSLSTVKNILNPSVVYATDRSKAVVPVLFLFCVSLWFILRDASCFEVCPCSLFSCFVTLFSIVITSLGEEGAGLCASRAFVMYVLVFVILLFLLVSGAGCGLCLWQSLDFFIIFLVNLLQNVVRSLLLAGGPFGNCDHLSRGRGSYSHCFPTINVSTFEPAHESMVFFVLRKLILQTRMRCHPVRLDVWFFGQTLCLLLYFLCANSEGSGETAWMRRLARAFACRLCDKYHNLMSWLILWFYVSFSLGAREGLRSLTGARPGYFSLLFLTVKKLQFQTDSSSLSVKKLLTSCVLIFQAYLDQGKIPNAYENAYISPVFKKGDRHKPLITDQHLSHRFFARY